MERPLPENVDSHCCRKYVLSTIHYVMKKVKNVVLLEILNLKVSNAWQHFDRNELIMNS